jgi:hypothetical protein
MSTMFQYVLFGVRYLKSALLMLCYVGVSALACAADDFQGPSAHFYFARRK